MSATTRRCGKFWWITDLTVDDPPPLDLDYSGIPQDWIGPYATRQDAEADLRGLKKFYNVEQHRKAPKS